MNEAIINIIKLDIGTILQFPNEDKEIKIPKSEVRIDRMNDRVGIYLHGAIAYKTAIDNITIQDGKDGVPEQLTAANWNDLTDGIAESEGGAGGMKKYDADMDGIVDDAARLGGTLPEGYVREVDRPAIVAESIEDTNATSTGYYNISIASNGKTYFSGIHAVRVLNELTGELEIVPNSPSPCKAIGIASNGKTYFCSN